MLSSPAGSTAVTPRANKAPTTISSRHNQTTSINTLLVNPADVIIPTSPTRPTGSTTTTLTPRSLVGGSFSMSKSFSPKSSTSPTFNMNSSSSSRRHHHSKTRVSCSPTNLVILGIMGLGIMNIIWYWHREHNSMNDYFHHLAAGSSSLLNLPTTTTSSQHPQLFNNAIREPSPKIEFPFEPPSPHTTVVFYHIFVPPTQEGRVNAARILQEQLQQLAASSSQEKYTLYYNTIGELTSQLDTTHIQQWCAKHANNLQKCIHMNHYDQGMEDKTLQRLHDFCSLTDSDKSIIYLHNKGSFTTKPLNEAWRYHMTQAVVSNECRDATILSENDNHSQQCNLCGLYFSAERGLFMAGNMWRSQCSYIQQLLPPHNFADAMHRVTSLALMERLRWKLLMTMQELRAGVFGIDRYATEFWIASHPSVRACDFSKALPTMTKPDMTDVFLGWLRKMGTSYASIQLKPEWFARQAPSHKLPLYKTMEVIKFPDVRLREYFLLPGTLFRQFELYGQGPPLDSWMFSWFPDGDQWRQAVQQYGNQSVAVVTEQAYQMEVKSGRNKYTADRTTIKTTKT